MELQRTDLVLISSLFLIGSEEQDRIAARIRDSEIAREHREAAEHFRVLSSQIKTFRESSNADRFVLCEI